ncbi:MAG: RNA polymerase sigma-70 factor [Candidatus Pseudobacter hemicellulosilyticus]|uniref:RNA polymerase sigma-70 factor n=1 Tax=Candidatus Pseudobacter hemicellulosilyticus TaxID=3121375 RepID=A0AAJ5WVW3_9BACT|nr:MAG: RNA polymerase sigma-70 factor [Pseudobacter sp.]
MYTHDTADNALPLLVQQVSAGSQQAFRQLYHYFYQRLYHFAFSLIRTREHAEEIVEDVFIKLWHQRAGITAIGNLKVYLYTATRNTALNYLERRARENSLLSFGEVDISLAEPGYSPEQLLITAEIYGKIRQAVEQLPPRCKLVFKLVREDGLKYKEVAEVLGISINTIDAQMAIAVQRIAEAVRKDFEQLPARKAAQKKDAS